MIELWKQIWTTGFIVGIAGNLAASAILGIPALIHLHRKIDRNHNEHMGIIRDRLANNNASTVNIDTSMDSNSSADD